MKILFITKYEYIEPLGIMYLSSMLKRHGYKCYFIDLKFEKDYINEVRKINPDVIAYSITTGKHRFFQEINSKLKEKFNFLSVFGGSHCTFFPEFINENGVDIICRGESEFALLELINKLKRGEDILKIENLWIKQYGKIYKNKLRNLIPKLDSIPYPDRELVNKYNHYKKMHRRTIITSRGCPFKCTYCFNHVYNKLYVGKGNVIRRRSVSNVINELKEVKNKYKPKRFWFVDDTFILNKQWTLNFCKKYKKEIKLPFICYVRANLVTEEIIKTLKEAGCITLVFAIESGNDYIRNKLLKRNMSEEQILNTAKFCNKYKINTYIQNMVGLPDETLENVWETIKLNIKCNPSYAWASIFQPYPETKLYNYSIDKGYIKKEELDLINETYYKTSILKIDNKKEIVRLHHLFSTCVAFPFIIPLVKQLVKLPLDKFYFMIWKVHRAWCYFFKIKFIDLSELFIKRTR